MNSDGQGSSQQWLIAVQAIASALTALGPRRCKYLTRIIPNMRAGGGSNITNPTQPSLTPEPPKTRTRNLVQEISPQEPKHVLTHQLLQ